MIKTFRHKGVERFFTTGSRDGIRPDHGPRLRLQLARLNASRSPRDMGLPGWRLHPLKGSLRGHWAVWVDKSWRLTSAFEGEDAVLVDYQDYHWETACPRCTTRRTPAKSSVTASSRIRA